MALNRFLSIFRRSPAAKKGGGQLKLNIGGGKGHPRMAGWTVVDIRASPAVDVTLDITRERLPFPDGSVDIIFTSHTLEHIYPHQLGFVLEEFHRVLKPESGLLRIVVPDITKACSAYINRKREFFRNGEVTLRDPDAPIGGLFASWMYSYRNDHQQAGYGHVHCFDHEYLAYWLKQSGFSDVQRSSYLRSSCEELRSEAFDKRPDASLFMEARN